MNEAAEDIEILNGLNSFNTLNSLNCYYDVMQDTIYRSYKEAVKRNGNYEECYLAYKDTINLLNRIYTLQQMRIEEEWIYTLQQMRIEEE